MALIDTYEDEEENEITTQGELPAAAPQGSELQKGVTPKKGSGWTNLENYISANEAGSEKMGQDVVKSIDQNIKSAQSKLGEQVTKTAGSAVKDTGLIENLKKDPSAVSREDFEKQYNASWNAPSSAQEFDEFGDVQSRVNKTSEAAKQADDFSGRKELLKTAYDEPKYSSGEQRLDSFILGGTNKGQENIKAIREKAYTAKTDWEEILGNFNTQLGDAKDLTNQTAANTRSAYDTAVADWDNKIKEKQSDADLMARKNEAKYLDLLSNLTSGNTDAYKQAGIDSNVGSYLDSLGYNVGNVLERGSNKALGDLVAPEMKDDYSALLGLRDLDSSYDLNTTGASGDAFRTNKDLLDRAGDVYNLGTSMDKRVDDMSKQQKTDYDTINRAFDSKTPLQERLGLASVVASRLGASEADVQAAMELGIDPSKFVKQGSGINRANVASADESKQWNELMSYLGLSQMGDKGSLYSTDGDAFNSALAAARLAQTKLPNMNKPIEQVIGEKIIKEPLNKVATGIPKVVDTVATPAKKVADTVLQKPMQQVGKVAQKGTAPVGKVVNATPKVADKTAAPVKKAIEDIAISPAKKSAAAVKKDVIKPVVKVSKRVGRDGRVITTKTTKYVNEKGVEFVKDAAGNFVEKGKEGIKQAGKSLENTPLDPNTWVSGGGLFG